LGGDLGLERLEHTPGGLIQPYFKRESINIMIEPPARRDRQQLVRGPGSVASWRENAGKKNTTFFELIAINSSLRPASPALL
jgi:hypothetical protein